MKPISYRNRLRLKRLGLFCLVAVLALILFAVALVVYLERYVVYSRDAAYLSFLHPDVSSEDTATEEPGWFPPVEIGEAGIAVRPDQTEPDEETPDISPSAIRGVYLSYTDLQNPSACLQVIHDTEECNTVLLHLKSNAGNFYYDSQLPNAMEADIDTAAVNQMIQTLHEEGYYLIARVSAFADTAFALEHISSSLQISGGALWMDLDGYYWLDAADIDVQSYLASIAIELNALGVDEIAFSSFLYPESPNIVYGELDEAARSLSLHTAASALINLGAQHEFAVSFFDPVETGPSASADGHIILSGYEGSAVLEVVERFSTLIDDTSSLIFLTDSRDTRFQPYGILRSCE